MTLIFWELLAKFSQMITFDGKNINIIYVIEISFRVLVYIELTRMFVISYILFVLFFFLMLYRMQM